MAFSIEKIFTVIIVIVLAFLFFRYLEKKSIYFPMERIEATPEYIGLDYDDVTLTTSDGIKINAWYIPAEQPRSTFLIFHGNGGNLSHRLEKIRMLNNLGVNIFIIDYRGYGESEGSPSEKGLYLDAQAAYNYLISEKKIASSDVIAYGESLGSAIVIELAKKHEFGGIILEEPFTSVGDMAKTIMPFIPSFIFSEKYDSLEKIKDIKIPKLVFHSEEDDIVPFKQGKRLFEAAPEPKDFVTLHGGHNDAFMVSQNKFLSSIDSFISKSAPKTVLNTP